MICTNGEQKTPQGETGIFFICQYEDNKGNHCRFSRWCKETLQYVSTSDKDGNVCKNFTIKL
jgi:hypothetical protein